MLAIRSKLKLINENICSKLIDSPVRGKRRHGHPWIKPKYWERPAPEKGVPYVHNYPLEPAQEERPYRLDRWTDWRMKKDYLRRQCVIKLGRHRMMLDTVYQNSILPREIKDIAEREVQETLPRDSNWDRLVRRCALHSRATNCVEPWRVGRHVFRQLADHNKLSGVQKALWS